MKPKKTALFVAALAALLLVLAACSSPPEEANRPGETALISVGLDAASLSTSDLSPLGSPYDSDGDVAVEEVRVWVYDADNELIRFDIDNDLYIVGTIHEYISLKRTATDTEPSQDIELPVDGNPYKFVSLGFDSDARADDEAIAFGEITRHVTGDTRIAITITSLIANAELHPRNQVNYAAAGATIDFMLTVTTPVYGGAAHGVPLNDFTVTYQLKDENHGTISETSSRGVRVVVDKCTPGETLIVVADVTGTGTALPDGTTTNTTRVAEVRIDCYPGGGDSGAEVYTDLEAPVVKSLEFDRDTNLVAFDVIDNIGIAKVQLYDGPILVASTEAAELVPDKVIEIQYDSTDGYTANLGNLGIDSLITIAWDFWGNEGSSEETANASYIHVNTCSQSGGIGTLTRPLNDLAEALALVAPYGTIRVSASFPGLTCQNNNNELTSAHVISTAPDFL